MAATVVVCMKCGLPLISDWSRTLDGQLPADEVPEWVDAIHDGAYRYICGACAGEDGPTIEVYL